MRKAKSPVEALVTSEENLLGIERRNSDLKARYKSTDRSELANEMSLGARRTLVRTQSPRRFKQQKRPQI